jgi:hypothetical protein
MENYNTEIALFLSGFWIGYGMHFLRFRKQLEQGKKDKHTLNQIARLYRYWKVKPGAELYYQSMLDLINKLDEV